MNEAYLAEFSEGFGYLDFASVGPPSRRVVAALTDVNRRLEGSETSVAGWAIGAYEAALATVARFVGVMPEQVTAVPSTSAGLFQVAAGLIGAGGNVVLHSADFPANLYPWLRVEAIGGPEVRLVDVPDGRLTAAALSEAVDDETRAIAVSLVDSVSGFRVDLADLRELADDALLVVDGTQALGAVAQGLAPADVLAATGVTWLRAGWGTGVIAVSHTALDRLEPTLTGWFGVEEFMDLSTPAPHPPRVDAERFREGSPSVTGAIACAEAVDVVDLAGIDVVEAAVLDRARELQETLDSIGAEVLAPWRSDKERAGVVSFRLGDEPAADTAQRLGAAGLVVGRRRDWVRLAVHATTDPAVTEALAEAL